MHERARTKIVGSGFRCEAKHGETLPSAGKKPIDAALEVADIARIDIREQRKLEPGRLAPMNERPEILSKASAAKPEPWFQVRVRYVESIVCAE